MKPIINDFSPPPKAAPYNPAKTVTVPGNGTEELTLKGRSADVFGIMRMLPYAPWPTNVPPPPPANSIEITATLNNDRILFKDVQLPAIRELFMDSELLAPLIIQENNDLTFTLTNTSGNDIDVSMQLIGYDGPTTRKLVSLYEKRGIKMPTPVFLFAKDEIAANADNQVVDIPSKSVDVELHRAAIRSDSDDDLTVSLERYNETIKNGVFVRQFNDEFSIGRRSFVPIEVGKSVPFTLKASNASSNPQTLSFFGEAYMINN